MGLQQLSDVVYSLLTEEACQALSRCFMCLPDVYDTTGIRSDALPAACRLGTLTG